ncbi:MAG: hypothetical protein AB8E15_02345 [Bdellovibrionales bacterium]
MRFYIPILVVLFSVGKAQAYQSVLETGDILPNDYESNFILETQVVTTGDDGFNLRGHFDQRVNESSQLRFTLGTGVNNLQAAAHYKFIPIPDFENQPAIGLIAGVTYASLDGANFLGLQAKAIVSKLFESIHGPFTPYAAITTGIGISQNFDGNPSQLNIGTKFKSHKLPNYQFYAEIGSEIADSFSYFSLGLEWQFEVSKIKEKIKDSFPPSQEEGKVLIEN